MSTIIASHDLDRFVEMSDELGGPGSPECHAYWADLEFQLETDVDQTLDPFGEAYVDRQLALYRELSGRELDQLVNEHTTIDVDLHVNAVNPYDHGSPGALSGHVERLSRAIRLAAPPRGGKALDMGCGWGLSAEVAAYTGLSVTAVDVNQDFVDLVNRRAARFGHDITAHHGTFEGFESSERFDLIIFYECLHHALRPWTVLTRMADMLTPGGQIVLAGEPINATWWEHWGLRLDPLSVYCIRKFGWLESGWSRKFIKRSFRRAGLEASVVVDPDREVGKFVIATWRTVPATPATLIAVNWEHDGWLVDGDHLVASDDSSLTLTFPEGTRRAHLGVQNFRGRDIAVQVSVDGGAPVDHQVPPGGSAIAVHRGQGPGRLRISSEQWSPAEELGSADTRELGFHLEDVSFH